MTGFFFADQSCAEHYFKKARYGEYATFLLGPKGYTMDQWGRNDGRIKDAIWKWWEGKSNCTGRAPTFTSRTHPREPEANVPSETDREEKEDAEAMKILRASFDGEEDTVDSVFEKMRGLLKVNRVVKEEVKEIKVPVSDLRFTQSKCSPHFRCVHRKLGDCPYRCPLRPIQDMTKDIVNGMDPSTQPWAVLTVVQLHGRLWSIDNRRLSAMKDAQKQIRETGGERVIWAKIRVFDFWPDEFQRFYKHLDHGAGPNDGKHIHVNRKRQRSP